MTDDDARIRKIVRVALGEIFETVGVDVTTPEGRKEFRDNMDWVNSFRTGAQGAKTVAFGVAITSFISGSFWLLWQGFKAAVTVGKGMAG